MNATISNFSQLLAAYVARCSDRKVSVFQSHVVDGIPRTTAVCTQCSASLELDATSQVDLSGLESFAKAHRHKDGAWFLDICKRAVKDEDAVSGTAVRGN